MYEKYVGRGVHRILAWGGKSPARSAKKDSREARKKISNLPPVKITFAPLKSTFCLIIS